MGAVAIGLAFAAAVAVSAHLEQRQDACTAAVAAIATYAVMRVTFAGGAIAPYCEATGYFFSLRAVCFDHVTTVAVTPMR